ncbi:MAG: hypothetical protein AAFX79_00215 [Planctomycetota bacterium]
MQPEQRTNPGTVLPAQQESSDAIADAAVSDLYRFALHLCGSPNEAADLTVACVASLDHARPLTGLEAARSVWTAYRSMEVVEPQASIDYAADSTRADIDDRLLDAAISRELTALSGIDRLIIILWASEQCDADEIADALSLPIRLARATIDRFSDAIWRRLTEPGGGTLADASDDEIFGDYAHSPQ